MSPATLLHSANNLCRCSAGACVHPGQIPLSLLYNQAIRASVSVTVHSHSVAVIRRSRSRVGVLVQLPHLSSTSYLSCIIDTSCKQTLLLPPLRPARAEQHDRTMHNTLFLTAFYTATHSVVGSSTKSLRYMTTRTEGSLHS
jgi:hypothetical protein